MKLRGLLIPFLFVAFAWSQQDIFVTNQAGPNYTIVRGKSWGASGVSGINNGYVIPIPTGTSGVCVTVRNNNPSNTHSFTPAVDMTTDPTPSGLFAGFPSWVSTYSVVGGNAAIAAPNASYTFYAPTAGATFAEVIILASTTAGGSPDTADVTAVAITNHFAACAGNSGIPLAPFQGNPNISDSYGYTGIRRGIYCDQFKVINVATATNVQVDKPPGAYPGTVQSVHVCGYVITGAPSTSASLTFAIGTAGNCTALGATVWEETSGITGTLRAALFAGGGNQLFDTSAVVSQPLCFRDNGTTSGVKLAIAYTIFQ